MTNRACPSCRERSCSRESSARSRTSHLCPSSCSCSSAKAGQHIVKVWHRSISDATARDDTLSMSSEKRQVCDFGCGNFNLSLWMSLAWFSMEKWPSGSLWEWKRYRNKRESKEGTHIIGFGLRHRHPLVDTQGRVSDSHPFLLPACEAKAKLTHKAPHLNTPYAKHCFSYMFNLEMTQIQTSFDKF